MQWLTANTAPLLVAAFVLAAAIANDLAFAGRAVALPRPPQPLEIPSLSLAAELRAWPVLIIALVLFAGACACFIGAVAWYVLPDFRSWLSAKIRHAVRPLPALRALDAIAVFLVWLCSLRIVGLNLIATGSVRQSELLAASLLVNGAAMLLALLTCIYLARHRSHGIHGSNGVWPFWRLAAANPQRSIWYDVGLGVLAYPLLIWFVYLSIIVNQIVLHAAGVEPDQHTLVTELARPQTTGVLAVVFFMATAGAAFFEEILFRGMLYNVLRRYFSAIPAACCAALLFSAAHMVWSQLLGLFVLALILTWLYEITGRLVASMTLHAVNNFISLALALQALQSGG
jgi:membrane protease YdiL (CAAX protease family)